MASQLDAKELIERLSMHYGGERGALPAKDENTNMENDGMEDLNDAELMQGFEEPDPKLLIHQFFWRHFLGWWVLCCQKPPDVSHLQNIIVVCHLHHNVAWQQSSD